MSRLLFLFVLTVLLGITPAHAQSDAAPKNVILFISDGCGPASFTMARDFLRDQKGVEKLAIDSLMRGSIRTYSSDSRVTDSAAGATAFACGVKTYNGAIAVDTAQVPVATILEAAERKGMATGLVATSRITHATPAAFSAHVPERGMENEIAAQQLTKGIEVILGGGRRHFLPEERDGRRTDGRDLLQEARKAGYTVIASKSELANAQAPLLGLFSTSHMDYEVDREADEQPSLAEMTRKAIDLLDDDPDGFFLMVEGSRIDHAGHGNDPAAHLHDVIAYDEAIRVGLRFADEDERTLLVSTSDHETGGLTLARDGEYAWHPGVLAKVKSSHGEMIEELLEESVDEDAIGEGGYEELLDEIDLDDVLGEHTGITDLTGEERMLIAEAFPDPYALNSALSSIISERARIGWTTSGHTAVDVNLYAHGPGAERLTGHYDNTALTGIIADLLDLDLQEVSANLLDDRSATPTP